MQPSSALLTAAISSLISTAPLPFVSKATHTERGIAERDVDAGDELADADIAAVVAIADTGKRRKGQRDGCGRQDRSPAWRRVPLCPRCVALSAFSGADVLARVAPFVAVVNRPLA